MIRLVAGVLGPVVFGTLLLTAPDYAALGVLAWLAIYWAVGVLPIVYTAAIPVVGFLLLGVEPLTILTSFAHPALVLVVAPTVAIVAAAHAGLVERAALFFVQLIGDSVRRHVIFWLVFATVLSDFAADTVVALALIPVVVRMLARAGYTTPQAIARSGSAMAVVIATSIGASLGGILTPMAGGQAAITWSALNTVLGGEVTVWAFTTRMLLPTTVSLGIVALVFACAPLPEKRFRFSEPAPKQRWSSQERVAAGLVVVAVVLPYARPWLPLSLPALYMVFMIGALIIVPWRALLQFPLGTISVWPIAMSVSTLVGVVGLGERVVGQLGHVWALEPAVAVGLWTALCVGLAQGASDTGAAGMLIPVLVSALPVMGLNPVPWILMTGFSVDLSFMVPSATGTIGVLYALGGRGHFLLPVYGFVCAVACGLFSWLFWTMVVSYEWQFWYALEIVG